jgi:hypothetical protein
MKGYAKLTTSQGLAELTTSRGLAELTTSRGRHLHSGRPFFSIKVGTCHTSMANGHLYGIEEV